MNACLERIREIREKAETLERCSCPEKAKLLRDAAEWFEEAVLEDDRRQHERLEETLTVREASKLTGIAIKTLQARVGGRNGDIADVSESGVKKVRLGDLPVTAGHLPAVFGGEPRIQLTERHSSSSPPHKTCAESLRSALSETP